MTRSLLGLLVLTALPAWAEEPEPEVLTPYEAVAERPLGETVPVSSSSLGVPEASGQSAVAPAEGTPEVTAYDAALFNATRSTAAPTPQTAAQGIQASGARGTSMSPWAQAVAANAAAAESVDAAEPVDVAKPLAVPAVAAPVVVAEPPAVPEAVLAVAQSTPPAAAVPQRPFTPPGGEDTPVTSSNRDTAREHSRRERREQRTVFGPRRHTRFVGLYAGGSLGAPGFGGPSSGALEAGALVGGSLRLGAEFRGLSYGRSGPDVRLASSGFVLGWAFKTRSMFHPTADVVFGAGVVSHSNGGVIGGVGLTAVRGGAELNVTRSVRLTASVGWRGISAPNPEVRRDLDGFEGLVGVRVGWF